MKFYITTAIDYVNSAPHLGTAYEKIAADAIARYKRRQGFDTFFLMGVDEHSLNVERSARRQGVNPQAYCDQMAKKFKDTWAMLNISFNRFIRTTQPEHIKAVQHFINLMYKKGDLYKGWYKGWYCENCEAFLKENDLIDGKCPVHKTVPQWIEEENYYFSLSKYQNLILEHIKKNPLFIQPETRRNEVINIIENGLDNISISRASTKWGIPLPFDAKQVVYVWVDALINYFSGIEYPNNKEYFNKYWPCDLHIIGKDITRFHCIIWPAMLMSADMPLPKSVFAHGFLYLNKEKMSKTKGTVIDPLEIAGKFGPDTIRYFLLREMPFGKDGEFTWKKFLARYRSDLANDIGNLLHRALNMIYKYNEGKIYKGVIRSSRNIRDEIKETVAKYKGYMEKYQLSQALSGIWVMVNSLNKYIEETSPWALKKQARIPELNCALYNLAEAIRIIGILIEPFMPQTSADIWRQIGFPNGIPEMEFEELSQWGMIQDGHSIGKAYLLFPKTDLWEG